MKKKSLIFHSAGNCQFSEIPLKIKSLGWVPSSKNSTNDTGLALLNHEDGVCWANVIVKGVFDDDDIIDNGVLQEIIKSKRY